ncbi:MAG: hypothetical protein KME26_31470 [Oscillatoria princeps RMCB-10]|nr:hypothetical protein [Oscillatoria princeps RMCB-10]
MSWHAGRRGTPAASSCGVPPAAGLSQFRLYPYHSPVRDAAGGAGPSLGWVTGVLAARAPVQG